MKVHLVVCYNHSKLATIECGNQHYSAAWHSGSDLSLASRVNSWKTRLTWMVEATSVLPLFPSASMQLYGNTQTISLMLVLLVSCCSPTYLPGGLRLPSKSLLPLSLEPESKTTTLTTDKGVLCVRERESVRAGIVYQLTHAAGQERECQNESYKNHHHCQH